MGIFNEIRRMFGVKSPYDTKEGYRQVYDPKNPMARKNGYVPEHRKKASRKIGRPLRSNEIVHHKDGNKKNNRMSNLQVMTPEEHWGVHHPKQQKR